MKAILGAALLMWALSGLAAAQGMSYSDAKAMYDSLKRATGAVGAAGGDCDKAAQAVKDSVPAYQKGWAAGALKDGWWNKTKMNDFFKADIATLHTTVLPKFRLAVLGKSKACVSHPGFQEGVVMLNIKE